MPRKSLQKVPDAQDDPTYQSTESKRDINLITVQLESFFSQPVRPEDLIEVVKSFADMVSRDDHLPDDLVEEEKVFLTARKFQSDPLPIVSAAGRLIFATWVRRSKNRFAIAFRLGMQHERAFASRTRQKRATAGRRSIGNSSRTKVAKEAENLKHMPKSKAALQIASEVNLSPEKVRAYLSELFPGKLWKP